MQLTNSDFSRWLKPPTSHDRVAMLLGLLWPIFIHIRGRALHLWLNHGFLPTKPSIYRRFPVCYTSIVIIDLFATLTVINQP